MVKSLIQLIGLLVLTLSFSLPVHANNEFINDSTALTIPHPYPSGERVYVRYLPQTTHDAGLISTVFGISTLDLNTQIYPNIQYAIWETNQSTLDQGCNVNAVTNVLSAPLQQYNMTYPPEDLGNGQWRVYFDFGSFQFLQNTAYCIVFQQFNALSSYDRILYMDNNSGLPNLETSQSCTNAENQNGTCLYLDNDPNLRINTTYQFTPVQDQISLQKISPNGNPIVDQTVTYQVDYFADQSTYVYFSCEETEGYQLHTSTASGAGLFQFICNYDFPLTFNPAVQLRQQPIGSGSGSSYTDFIPVTIVDPQGDDSIFSLSETSITLGDTQQFTIKTDSQFHQNITSIELDYGIPHAIQQPLQLSQQQIIDSQSSSGITISYTYSQNPGTVNINSKLTINSSDTKQYNRSFLLFTSDQSNVFTDNFGGSFTIDDKTFHLSSNILNGNTSSPITFTYFISQLPNCSYVQSYFYPNNVNNSTTLSLQTDAYLQFEYTFTTAGLYTPRLSHEYTCNSTSYFVDTYIGSSQLVDALTIDVIDTDLYCINQPYFTDQGIFMHCQQINDTITSVFSIVPFADIIALPIFHNIIRSTSFMFAFVDNSQLVTSLKTLLDPPSKTYILDTTFLANTTSAYFPQSFTLNRPYVNSTPIDDLITFFIHLYFAYLYSSTIFFILFRRT